MSNTTRLDHNHEGFWAVPIEFIEEGVVVQMGAFAFALYCVLIRYSQDMQSPPSYSVLQAKTGFSRPTISKCLKKLNDMGYVPRDAYEQSGYVYLLHAVGSRRYKIGLSKDVAKRVEHLNKQSPFKILLVHAIATSDMDRLECYFHKRFADSRVNGEWFELTESAIAEFMNHEEAIAL